MHVANLKTSHDYPSSPEPMLSSSREEQMRQAGRERHLQRQQKLADRGTAADRDDYSSLIRRSLLGVADRIAAALEDNNRPRTGKPSALLLKLNSIEGSDKEGYRGVTVGYITLSTIFSSLVKTSDKSSIAASIGRALESESKYRFIQKADPDMWKRLVRIAKERHGDDRHQSRFVLNTAAHEGVAAEEWSSLDRCRIGEWLIGIAEKAELITISNSTSSNHTSSEVVLQDHVIAWLEEYRVNAGEMITPLLSPMTTVPVDWSTPNDGGYEQLKYALVRDGRADYGNADMSRVYHALNVMQRTPWRVNADILQLVETLWAEGTKIGKLPIGLHRALPERMADEVWEALSKEERKAHALELREVHDFNRQATSDLVTINMVLAQARELRDEPTIYMPYFCDYRGRVYCQPLLNPQKSDYIRAMLDLARGKPLGERGAMWLAIQVATLWDGPEKLSKKSFDDRYEWTLDNEAFLRSIVQSPTDCREWANADKPFQFLRSAMDWVGFLDEGESFVSHVPIALDGSCSGIQHYAAALRDADVGSRVNLTPSDLPADVYGDVANLVLPLVQEDVGNTSPIHPKSTITLGECADWWLQHGLSRKEVKRPTMTYGYSSREAGFTRVYDKEFVLPATGKRNDKLARYLAKKTLTAVEQLLPAVANGMDWLQKCAGLLAHEGKGISWVAPSGFPVRQKITTSDSVRVATKLGGERLRISVPGAVQTVSKEKQKNAIAPNHTHSLDAAHLVLTVVQADEYGVTDFALIHDSFGTLAADTDAMFAAVRDAFVAMYEENDPLQHLYDRVYADLSEAGREKLPKPPAKGTLDLSLVQQSLYAFA
jgi:DNA-directed RNA polymerase